ncbi:hypothetical protein BC332_34665 [Capsicum chinense]|nr:hypothetical protein BC332_34665 [Capsicum chinense]
MMRATEEFQQQKGQNLPSYELKRVGLEEFVKRIITGYVSWVYGYDPETKVQSSVWIAPGRPRPKKARKSCSNVKTMLTVFFDHEGVVRHEYAPQYFILNKESYRDILRSLRGLGERIHDGRHLHDQRRQSTLSSHCRDFSELLMGEVSQARSVLTIALLSQGCTRRPKTRPLL